MVALEFEVQRPPGRIYSCILDKVMFTLLRLIPSVEMLTDCSELLYETDMEPEKPPLLMEKLNWFPRARPVALPAAL